MDLVSIAQVAALLARHPERARERLFTVAEVQHCERRGRPEESYAARFAAKEAFFKALGTGWGRGGDWTDVEVVSTASGAPGLRLSGIAAAHAAQRGIIRCHVSLTHTEDLAGAYVLLEA